MRNVGLSSLQNLVNLYLDNNQIIDIEPLSNLNKIVYLRVKPVKIYIITP